MKIWIWIVLLTTWVAFFTIYATIQTSDLPHLCWHGYDEERQEYFGGCKPYYGDVLRDSTLQIVLWIIGLIALLFGLGLSLRAKKNTTW